MSYPVGCVKKIRIIFPRYNGEGTLKIRPCSQTESFSHLNRSCTLDFCRNFGKSLKESSYENYFYTKQPWVRSSIVHIKNMLVISYKNLILVPIIFLITKKHVFFIIAEYLHLPTDSKNIMVVMVLLSDGWDPTISLF